MNRFRVNKIGLLNFWLYDEEEYDFYGGKLILRGANGSGKSVTMQSFIPLILDGNKSPDRLDPFGSKERKIEDYILGDAENIQKEEATSYLYMETYLENEKKYITIGLGFRGRKGKPVESWGFALKDGKRINKDFYLYKDPVNKIPLSKNELKSRLGPVNNFTDNTKDYKAMVNDLLFGFPNLDTYDEFIKLLLQLRSNKLSRDYKPTNLIDVLNKVLQPLTEDDLRPLSEAIEQMNKTKEQIEKLEKNHKCLKDFLKVYNNYNTLNLLTKARNYKKASDEFNAHINKINISNQELQNFKDEYTQKENRHQKVIEEIAINEETKKQFDNSDLKQKVESLNTIKENINTLKIKLAELETKIDNNEQTKIRTNNNITETENEIYKIKKEITENITDLKEIANDTYFKELNIFLDNILKDNNPNLYETINDSLKLYKDKVSKIKNLLEEEQKILLENENSHIELEKLINSYKELENNLKNTEQNLRESIMSWEEDFINKINNNAELKISDDIKQKIFELINFYSKENYDLAKELYTNYAWELKNNLISDILKQETKLNTKKEDLKIIENEYQELENKEDFELPLLNNNSEELLKLNHIESLPLYKCLEFKANIPENIKNNLESSLLDLNILNAKIIKENDIPKISNLNTEIIYLTKGTKKKNNLTAYFDIKLPENSTLDPNYIKEILESISIDDTDEIVINKNGLAKIGILNSIADKNYKQTFIGFLKRLELKKNELNKLNEKITILKQEISTLENIIENNKHKAEIINSEINNFPNNKLINDILNTIADISQNINWNDQHQKEIEAKLTLANNKLKEIKDHILKGKQGLEIPLNLNAYQEVFSLLASLKEKLDNLKLNENTYWHKNEFLINYQNTLADIINNIAYLEADKNERTKELNINLANEKNINALLETSEYQNQKEQLLKLEQNLTNLNQEKEKLIKETSGLSHDISYKETEIKNLNEEKTIKQQKLDVYYEIFLREYKLGYVYQDEVIDIASTIKKILNDNKEQKEYNLNIAKENFISSFNKYSLELNEYSLKSFYIFNDYETTNEELKNLYAENIRNDVSAMYQGIKLNIIELFHKLEADIAENKDLISTQDRRLFEEILLNTVGEKIRNRINSSREWIEKINKIMATMQENSALRFKLIWKSISADNEGEIDTKELVRILKISPDMLKDEDKEKLTNHFRSKIKKAEELYEDSYTPFAKIMEEILDYRTWFSFQLLYERKGEDFKELTDKTFARFSGGERAKSMYIPLFASVYAKLNMARNNALRLIALDEAFAGVDEDNIREMFGILNNLNLDFVINSQVLWGDYDTISDLSICELIRPQNSQTVSVERYRWNGKIKEIINNRKEYNEEIENA